MYKKEDNIMIDKEKVAPRLSEVLRDQHLTIKELGDMVSLSKATISRYINGKMAPKGTFIQIVATKFGYNPVWLMGGDVDKYAPKSRNAQLNSRNERDIQKRLNAILSDMDADGMAMFNGDEEMDLETKELLKASIENSVRLAKIRAKEKFTPKKYKK
jgi:transcriptional regulator with XRE-family HTH domain